jgi:alkylated DNA repair protein (DNA oxidative demethylase)
LFALPAVERLADDVMLLRSFAEAAPLVAAIDVIAASAPLRFLRTRGGPMSVAMSNCGAWGWHSDEHGYRYVDRDPMTGRAWPAMPAPFRELARRASQSAGFASFDPDCCLINRYVIGARMGTHRDFDELDLAQPIVSVSLGLPATFLWYGAKRTGRPLRVTLNDGDVLVWGRTARAGYHGVRRIEAPPRAAADAVRYNLTFRRAK